MLVPDLVPVMMEWPPEFEVSSDSTINGSHHVDCRKPHPLKVHLSMMHNANL